MPVHDWTRVGAGTFHDFHCTWIVELRRTLNRGVLPAGYYAMAEQKADDLGPDVLTLQRIEDEPGPPAEPEGAAAVAVVPPRVRFRFDAEEEVYSRKRRTLVVRHVSGDRVIALIEIVSLGNKGSRHAIRSFVGKVASALRRGVHVLVADLHPPGRRDPQGLHPLIWERFTPCPYEPPPGKPLTLASYSAGPMKSAFVEPVGIGDPLPDMPLFLTPEFYISVPLEASYMTAFADVPDHLRQGLEAPPT